MAGRSNMTTYQRVILRIARALYRGGGVRLSAEDVDALLFDDAIDQHVESITGRRSIEVLKYGVPPMRGRPEGGEYDD